MRPRCLSGAFARPLSFTVRSHMRGAVVPLVLTLVSCSASNGCPDMHFAQFRDTTRVVITVDSHPIGRELTSPSDIAGLVAFAEAHGTGWSYPWYGPPVARLSADFYAGSKFLGDLGVGTTFLSAQGCGYFQSRTIGASDRQRLVAMLGAPDPYAAQGK